MQSRPVAMRIARFSVEPMVECLKLWVAKAVALPNAQEKPIDRLAVAGEVAAVRQQLVSSAFVFVAGAFVPMETAVVVLVLASFVPREKMLSP